MGGFLGIGGASWKTDRGNELSGMGDLKSVYNFALPFAQKSTATGQATTDTGVDALGKSLAYFKSIMSGNRAATAAATAPETNAVQAQSDAAARQQLASGTARGGGTAGANRTAQDDALAKIDNFLLAARPSAASETANIGSQISRIGQTEVGQGLQSAALGERSASDLTGLAGEARGRDYKINQDMVGKASQAIENILTGFFA